jgi:hypothetical protein
MERRFDEKDEFENEVVAQLRQPASDHVDGWGMRSKPP